MPPMNSTRMRIAMIHTTSFMPHRKALMIICAQQHAASRSGTYRKRGHTNRVR